MSNATEQLRSTRSDARAFAEAFAGVEDAFTFGPDAGESRTLTLAELGEVIDLDLETPVRGPRIQPRPAAPTSVASSTDVDRLLSLEELSEALARPAAPADDLEFDFGTRAHERAQRRTAARLGASPSSRRRASGPAARPRQGADPASTSGADRAEPSAAPAGSTRRSTPPVSGRAATAVASGRIASPRSGEVVLKRSVAPPIAGRTPAAPGPAMLDRLRANPDRIAVWAVLLGIVLVLIAFTSGSAGAVVLPILSL